MIWDRINSVDCTLGYKATVRRRPHIQGGNDVFKKLFHFPLEVMQNSILSTQILAKIYRSRLKECDYHKIQQYSDQN